VTAAFLIDGPTGSLSDCVDSVQPASCTSSRSGLVFQGSFRLHGTAGDYLLYVSLDGDDTGPGDYRLQPWTHPGLDYVDGTTKVALRVSSTGASWESVGGTLSVFNAKDAGFVDAIMESTGVHAARVDMSLIGEWNCHP
jgi:hypothetical protein